MSHRQHREAKAVSAEAAYRPTMPAARARALRTWHDDAHARIASSLPLRQAFLGLNLVVAKDVYPPGDEAFYQFVRSEVLPTDAVLDMGTGSGIVALLAAQITPHVTAVDINPAAIECAQANARSNRLQSRITFRRSDVFSAVPETFDLIIFNPPYRWFAPRSPLEMATADKGYRALRTFIAQVRSHLRPHGRILMSFGSSGDIDYLHSLIDANGFTKEVVPYGTLQRHGLNVNYYNFRLTA